VQSMLFVITVFFLSVLFSTVHSTYCHDSNPVFGPTNDFPIFEGNPNLVFINQTKNGKLYEVTVPNSGGGGSTFRVIHLWGTAYEMGFAQGTLLKEGVSSFLINVWNYMESEITSGPLIKDLPKWLANLIADMGLDAALEFTHLVTAAYTPSYFYDEMRGLADATGMDYTTLVYLHMVAGLTQGKCSMLGSWGDALDPSSNTKLLQLRALDWDMDGPFRNYPALTVYHPNPGNGNSFALVGMTGFIGGLTGISDKQLGISEIGVSYPDSSFGSESRIGYPFIFLLRDILQWDLTVDDATSRLANAKRTCDLIFGVGDGKLGQFRGYQYSSSVLHIFNDENMMPIADWHPKINHTVYWGMDWLCPADNYLLSHQIQKYWGKLTPAVAIKNVASVEQSGDNHIAYYDLTNLELYVSYAAPHNSTNGSQAAYARQFTHFFMKQIFEEKPPMNVL